MVQLEVKAPSWSVPQYYVAWCPCRMLTETNPGVHGNAIRSGARLLAIQLLHHLVRRTDHEIRSSSSFVNARDQFRGKADVYHSTNTCVQGRSGSLTHYVHSRYSAPPVR